jgi:hypothetical protein
LRTGIERLFRPRKRRRQPNPTIEVEILFFYFEVLLLCSQLGYLVRITEWARYTWNKVLDAAYLYEAPYLGTASVTVSGGGPSNTQNPSKAHQTKHNKTQNTRKKTPLQKGYEWKQASEIAKQLW